ncbi:hypothetical protein EYF80_038261 [Liparis tanakae]|uniref:Uncharacterized protein n=1 Tax=Liparis tanakae TaxID=230148 RepID=A0A4Z2GE25_9TELE|nr:hypothetical protein EYF80_038261 [Liparis tanakae]
MSSCRSFVKRSALPSGVEPPREVATHSSALLSVCGFLIERLLDQIQSGRLRSMRSESSCLRMSVAYSSRLCSAVMMSEAT